MIYINNEEKNNIEIDSTLFFGRGVFETIHITEKPILLKEHIDRINSACRILNIDKILYYKEVLDFINIHNLKNTAFKITVTEKSVIYSTREIPYTKKQYSEGFNIGVSSVIRNSTSKLTYIKSTCYIENILEKQRGEDRGFNEIIFLNEKGQITEGCTSNIFFYKDNKIHTPKVECGLLNGIVRQWIINNFQVIQGEYTLKDLELCDGIFLTNSLLGVMKVNSLNGKAIKESEEIKIIQSKYIKYITN